MERDGDAKCRETAAADFDAPVQATALSPTVRDVSATNHSIRDVNPLEQGLPIARV